MTIVNAAECYINTNCYKGNKNITNIDLMYIPWVNNSMSSAFTSCSNLISVKNISSNVTNMYATFNACSNLINTPILPYSVTNMVSTFAGCHKLNYSENIPHGVTNMYRTFQSCNKLVTAPSIPNTVTNMDETFSSCSNLLNPPIINHCLNLTDVSGMFEGCGKLTQIPELPPSVTKMGFAKYSAGATYGYAGGTNITTMCNIPNSVTDMSAAFWECFNLVNTTTIPNSVTNMSRTFSACLNLTNAPIIPDSVTVMTGTFERCKNLQGDICIQSSNVTAAANCFNTKVLAADIEYNKYVWIKPNTTTWNTFISAGYDTNGTQNKVFMREWDGTFSNLTVNVTPNTATVNIVDVNDVSATGNCTCTFKSNATYGARVNGNVITMSSTQVTVNNLPQIFDVYLDTNYVVNINITNATSTYESINQTIGGVTYYKKYTITGNSDSASITFTDKEPAVVIGKE